MNLSKAVLVRNREDANANAVALASAEGAIPLVADGEVMSADDEGASRDISFWIC
jgi:head-tail adaptor